ncbi:MAG: hypothetical protein ABJB74_04655 [Gemmatimonas sp.]
MSESNVFDIHSDDGARRLLYLCAFVLFLVPYFQGFANIWPFLPGSLQWRYGATGQFSGILMLPFIGMVLGLAIARTCGHKGIARVIGVVSAFTTLVLIVALGLFVMDALQVKQVVNSRQMDAFNKVTVVAMCTIVMTVAVYVALTVVAFRPPQGDMKVSPPKTKLKSPTGDASPGLLIGQDYSK